MKRKPALIVAMIVYVVLLSLIHANCSAASLSIVDYGAIANDEQDDSLAITKALVQAAQAGEVVQIPVGRFRLDSPVAIPRGTRLEGVGQTLRASHLDRGSVLELTWGRGDENTTPCLLLAEGSSLAGVTIYFPEQTVENPTPYPWAIQGRGVTPFATNPTGSSQHYTVENVIIVNAWNGIDCGTYHNEGHHLRNIQMCALKTGVYIDNCSDVGRLENVHIHNVYWWRGTFPKVFTTEQRLALEAFTLKNLIGFKIGRTDWEYVSNCFVIWAKIGFQFVQGNPKPTYKQGQPNVLVSQSGSDVGPLAVSVECSQSHAGIAFVNCQFMGAMEIGPNNKGPVKVTNSGFWGRPGNGSQISLQGKGTLTLMATHFATWDTEGLGRACIDAHEGRLILQGCEFHPSTEGSGPHLRLQKSVSAATIIGNIFRDAEIKIENDARGKVEIVGNIAVPE